MSEDSSEIGNNTLINNEEEIDNRNLIIQSIIVMIQRIETEKRTKCLSKYYWWNIWRLRNKTKWSRLFLSKKKTSKIINIEEDLNLIKHKLNQNSKYDYLQFEKQLIIKKNNESNFFDIKNYILR